MEVVVLGCGPSSGIPTLRCVVRGNCGVCCEAHANLDSKNRRLNPSLLIRNVATAQNVLIDCGKTFREVVLRLFPSLGIQFVDAVLLTHGHADACMGLDDLREVQRSEVRVVNETGKCTVPSAATEVHCSRETHEDVAAKFDYLVEKPSDPVMPMRWVAQLRMCEFTWFQPFQVCGLSFVPLPVWHGADYVSAAFEFGMEAGIRFVYISDISALPDQTRAYLTDNSRPRIDVLMIDALRMHSSHPTHMSLDAALREVLEFRPKRTFLTGMGHDFDYASTTASLVAWSAQHGSEVRMAYDGLRIQPETLR